MIRDFALDLLTGRGVMVPAGALVFAGALVYTSASRLARHADEIADATGLGRLWIGTVLLAASTSLPELTTDVNAAALGAPDIGVGDLIGSSLANMLILALLDLGFARRRILDHVSADHLLVGLLAVILMTVAGAAVATGGWGHLGRIGVAPILIVVLYLFGMRTVYTQRPQTAPPEQLHLGETSASLLRRGLGGFGLAALGLIVTAPLLVLSAEALAREAGLSETFVGTLLVGLTTSFPEAAATSAAVRIGALDLAVGNIFGSNAINLCLLLPMDLASARGPVLSLVAPQNSLSAQLAVLAMAFGMLGILARGRHRIGPVRIESALIVLTYAGAAWLLARP